MKQRHKTESKVLNGKKMHRIKLPNGDIGPWALSKADAWRHFIYINKFYAKKKIVQTRITNINLLIFHP